MNSAIKVEKLQKSYGENKVLKGISFEVEKGEIFALLGVNGAGKTTALECIEGLRRQDGGSVTINGKTGVQLQSSALPSYLRPMEAVKLFSKWKKVEPNEEMLKSLGIDELAKKTYNNLSTGQKRRLNLALALIGDPDVVFLDEPTAGLDAEGRLSLHRLIRELKNQGKTIVLASHDMAEVEALCDRIAILKDGNIAFIGSVVELTEKFGRRHILRVKTDAGEDVFETEDIGEALLSALTEYRKKGVFVTDVRSDRGSLEQHFISVSRGER